MVSRRDWNGNIKENWKPSCNENPTVVLMSWAIFVLMLVVLLRTRTWDMWSLRKRLHLAMTEWLPSTMRGWILKCQSKSSSFGETLRKAQERFEIWNRWLKLIGCISTSLPPLEWLDIRLNIRLRDYSNTQLLFVAPNQVRIDLSAVFVKKKSFPASLHAEYDDLTVNLSHLLQFQVIVRPTGQNGHGADAQSRYYKICISTCNYVVFQIWSLLRFPFFCIGSHIPWYFSCHVAAVLEEVRHCFVRMT